jgi:sugar phosphate isomerase/epimerase
MPAGGDDARRFRVGYATSGFSNHRLDDAVAILAEMGYEAITLTLDVHHLDPLGPDLDARATALRHRLDALGLGVVVECGARFVLDPRRKHRPTLMDREGAVRERFVERAIRVAAILGADCVSLWSGVRPEGMDGSEAHARLGDALLRLVAVADAARVDLAFEPEPGMLVETVAQFVRLHGRLGAPPRLGLSLDVGHVLVTGEGEPAEIVREHRGRLFTVALEDMRPGVHEHLPFGEGSLDLAAVVAALRDARFGRIASVELPRHGHDAVRTASRSLEALRAAGAFA